MGPGFFGKMGIPLIAGREFKESDWLARKVAVVNQTFVKASWRGAIRWACNFPRAEVKLDTTIVGVVKDSHYSSVKEAAPKLYYRPVAAGQGDQRADFYVRTAMPENRWRRRSGG